MSLLYSNNLCAAFVTEIVASFEEYHRSHYLGRTAMQKLAYFSQALGAPIPCSFEIYNFGPYSDAITFTIESMIADDLLQDTSLNPKYSNYRLKPGGARFGDKISASVRPHADTIRNVVRMLGKFEPMQLEVLSTLHFLAKKVRSLRGDASKEAVLNQFFRVKGDKFPVEEVSSWYDALKSAQLV